MVCDTSVTALDMSKLSQLGQPNLVNMQVANLDISQNLQIEILSLSQNSLVTDLDLSNHT